jgi:hypothetical protein
VFSDIGLDEAVPQVCKEGHFLDQVLYLLIEPLVLRGFVILNGKFIGAPTKPFHAVAACQQAFDVALGPLLAPHELIIAFNALAETVIGLFKTEVIHHRGPWRSLEAVEFATLEWVDWFNYRRLLEPIGNMPPAEAEARYYASLDELAMAA